MNIVWFVNTEDPDNTLAFYCSVVAEVSRAVDRRYKWACKFGGTVLFEGVEETQAIAQAECKAAILCELPYISELEDLISRY